MASQTSSPITDSDIDSCFYESLEVSPASYGCNYLSDEFAVQTNSPSYSNSQYGSPASSSDEYYTQNSIKQESEVPRVKGPTKTKKRVPQNSKSIVFNINKNYLTSLKSLLMRKFNS